MSTQSTALSLGGLAGFPAFFKNWEIPLLFLCWDRDTADGHWNMRGYVDMVADLFHIGHANQLRRVRELGYTVVVGVHSDDAVKAYKSSPVMAMAERVAAVEACKYADEVIPDAPIVIDEEFLTRHRIDMVFHGHTEAEDHLYREMYATPMRLGKFMRTERTPGISTTMLIARIARNEGDTQNLRVSSLFDALQGLKQSRTLRVMETHNGITGIIAETARVGENEFDALWSSSLTASVSKGKPDIEVVDTTARMQLVRDTMEVTQKPLIYDADTGGEPESCASRSGRSKASASVLVLSRTSAGSSRTVCSAVRCRNSLKIFRRSVKK